MRRIALALLATASAGAARAEPWEARSGGGNRILVHVLKKGLFSGFAHDHHFEVGEWRATAEVAGDGAAPGPVEVVLEAGSLHDTQARLSAEDRRKVDAQAAGPEVLDAEHHPRIEFRSDGFEADPGSRPSRLAGRLRGSLAIRGRSVPLEVRVEASRGEGEWSVRGRGRLKQSDAGIVPFSGFAGTVGVEDEVEIELALTLRPRSP